MNDQEISKQYLTKRFYGTDNRIIDFSKIKTISFREIPSNGILKNILFRRQINHGLCDQHVQINAEVLNIWMPESPKNYLFAILDVIIFSYPQYYDNLVHFSNGGRISDKIRSTKILQFYLFFYVKEITFC